MNTPIWRFRVEADRISEDPVRHRVRLTTDSGAVYEREGWSPMYELIRILGDRAMPTKGVNRGETDETQ